MITKPASNAPNLVFSHMGLTVSDLEKMERFYTEVLGFSVTDRGHAGGVPMVFLSRDPAEHHQLVLAAGRPEQIPPNTLNPKIGSAIHHISFRMASVSDLRDISDRLAKGGATNVHPANHGVMLAVYANDPEGNYIEFFMYTPWYIRQPFLEPLDLAKDDADILAETRVLCERSAGFEPFVDWQDRQSRTMNVFSEAGAPEPLRSA